MSKLIRSGWAGCARIGVAVVLAVQCGWASAGLFEDDEARLAIKALRQQFDTLQLQLKEQVQRNSDDAAQLRRSILDLQNQLETSRAELAQLRGQNEQIARDLSEMQRRQKDTLQSTDERLRKLEPLRITVDGKEFVTEAVERRDYENALGVFRKGDFANAQALFVDFLNRYAQTGYRASALFWLGNAQYATKNYKEALANFRMLVAVAPDHARVPEALLAVANCQLELKELKAARKTLEDIVANYATSEAAAAAKDRLSRFK